MLYKIYGLRVAGSAHVFLIGQTHQSLARRKRDHVKRAQELFVHGLNTPKTQLIMHALQNGQDIEIVELDEIEAQPRYGRRRDGSRYAIASQEVYERERLWQQTYLRQQGGPMIIDGKIVYG